ncbi:hypothetical protein Tco_0340960 [Tanacetum coccineum]
MNNSHPKDLDHLSEIHVENYFEKASSDTTINSAAQPTHDPEDSPSTSSIIVDTHEAPLIVTTSDKQTSPISLQESDDTQTRRICYFEDHPLDQVIGDPSKPVMTGQRLHTDSEVCMYALTVSTIEPKNIKEAMADHSWIESMQDELNQFEKTMSSYGSGST